MSDIKLGVTLYSYSNEYVSMAMDFESILRTAKRQGFQGVEFIPAQMAPEYPCLSDTYLDYLKNILRQTGLQPVCWSAYIDMGIRADRNLSKQEIIQYTVNDLVWASKAGFPMVRTQHAIGPQIFREMIPICKELGMKLAIEMHHPHHPDVPVWKEYLALMRGEGKGVLGVVPDMGIFQHSPHKPWLDEARQKGCRPEVVQDMLAQHKNNASTGQIKTDGYSEVEKLYAEQLAEQFNPPAKIEQLAEIMDCVSYIHGKFYYLEDDAQDPCVPYHKLLPMIRDSGYKGYIACEFEGHHYAPDLDSVEQMDFFIKMAGRFLG